MQDPLPGGVRCIAAPLVQRAGWRRTSGARTGVVTLIQRHGTHAHGQGYSDINFMIPELIDRIEYKKVTYY